MTVAVSQRIEILIDQKLYIEASELCEKEIEDQPADKDLYWRLGLVLILQGKEEEAHMVWMSAMFDGQPEDIESWTSCLTQILCKEADRQLRKNEVQTTWLIRQHISELVPNDINNQLNLLKLHCNLNYPVSDRISEFNLIEAIKEVEISNIDAELLRSAIHDILKTHPFDDQLGELVEASFRIFDSSTKVDITLLDCCFHYVSSLLDYDSAVKLAELYLRKEPDNLEFIGSLSTWYSDLLEFDKSLPLAEKRYRLSKKWLDKVYSSQLRLRSLMGSGGLWIESCMALHEFKSILGGFDKLPPESSNVGDILRLITSTFFLPYFTDEADRNRGIHNEVAKIFARSIQIVKPSEIQSPQELLISRYEVISLNKKIRIGYISHCFRKHSVGWLARGLIQHHSREIFELYGYVIHLREYDDLQQWYLQQFDKVCVVGIDCEDSGDSVAKKIYEDEIDILIDLDSITFDMTSQVMAHKPAPVQATWLGWDASGIPSIDYYIADNYSIPDEGQDYYAEKIWRLPECYISVDGFDVGVPDINRRDLDIPNNAIVYMSAQNGYKRHRDTVKLQMQILAAVPNSYLLIKGPSDNKAIQKYFEEVAAEAGALASQLRFLPQTLTGAVHRANLRIADIVLDTFPYNGATTTLEALWMEVPLVTLVGKQFAARNSYTMLKNVGVEEGIAWTAEEYIQWGITLGTDATLRQNVAWKLRQSKNNAPLWNAKAFTKQMEDAYQQMWDIYLASGQS